jgi:hypothetical protein
MTDESPYHRCLNCGWVHFGVARPQPAPDRCFRCKRFAFEVIDDNELLRTVLKFRRSITGRFVTLAPSPCGTCDRPKSRHRQTLLQSRRRCGPMAGWTGGGLPNGSRSFAVPLGKFQSRILLALAAQRSPDSYIAGGVAINREGPRFSGDIDIFHDSEAGLGRLPLKSQARCSNATANRSHNIALRQRQLAMQPLDLSFHRTPSGGSVGSDCVRPRRSVLRRGHVGLLIVPRDLRLSLTPLSRGPSPRTPLGNFGDPS